MNLWPKPPMLAVNIDDVDVLVFPVLGQPKLNGIRACWDGKRLISRQMKVFNPEALPRLYAKLADFTARNPGIALDGELYCHGMPLQELIKRTAINRQSPHPDSDVVEFHGFDIISDDDTESRQITLCQLYQPWVAVCKIESRKELDLWTERFCEAGFEGLMLRQYGCPYVSNRTEVLIKVKPWKYANGVIVGFTRGLGKYQGVLGALKVAWKDGPPFSVSGGLSDAQRVEIWKDAASWLQKPIGFKYRELSNAGKPLQPQITLLVK